MQRLNTRDEGFTQAFHTLLHQRDHLEAKTSLAVVDIIEDVKKRGDAGVIDCTQRFDGYALTPETMRVPPADIDKAYQDCPQHDREALETAAQRITSFHERQRPQNERFQDALGMKLGHRWTAVRRVGIYVPGGTANYPSSVLMNALPARVAGVGEIIMVTPARQDGISPYVLTAAKIAGIDKIYRIGGAQAIAAMALGTKTIPPVDKITGPGNQYVAAAKKHVYGMVGIDSIAGPSEILIVADDKSNPAWVAADLLSQAEHDTTAQSILITDSHDLAEKVEKALNIQMQTLPRVEIIKKSLADFGAIIKVHDWKEASKIVDDIAPEHLAISLHNPEEFFATIHNAGSVFLGRNTPETLGDYVAGPNHVLPTARAARFASGLSVLDFMKRTSFVDCSPQALAKIGPSAIQIAQLEGLGAHARAVEIRLQHPLDHKKTP